MREQRVRAISSPTTIVAGVILLMTVTSSISYALARRHVAWDGLLMGKGTAKIRGPIGMVGGKTAGTTLVTVSYKGDVGGATRPWHVHIGSCAKGGAVFGDAASYTPLKASAAGAAEGSATLNVALPDSGSFYVNIHESVAKMGNIVACGDLLLED